MNTLTQEELDRLKSMLNKGLWARDFALFRHAPSLIAAAEEGLRAKAEIQRLIDETHRWSAAERKAKVDHEEDKKALRARVQELEEALRVVMPMAKGYAAEHKVGNNDKMILSAQESLSNSTPQPPRYTLEEILADFQATHDALDREDAPTVKSAYGLAVAHLKQMIADSLPPAPQQKEGA